jgi:hypothetical protein
VATRCQARVYDRSFAGIAVSKPAGRKEICPFESKVDVPASGWSLVQRSSTECVGRCPCVRLIARPEEFYRVCVSFSVTVKSRKWGPASLGAIGPWTEMLYNIFAYYIKIFISLGVFNNIIPNVKFLFTRRLCWTIIGYIKLGRMWKEADGDANDWEKLRHILSAPGIACQSGRNAYSNIVRINDLTKLFLNHTLC